MGVGGGRNDGKVGKTSAKIDRGRGKTRAYLYTLYIISLTLSPA